MKDVKEHINNFIDKWSKEPVKIDSKMIDIYENPTKYSFYKEINSFNDIQEKPLNKSNKIKSKFIGGLE